MSLLPLRLLLQKSTSSNIATGPGAIGLRRCTASSSSLEMALTLMVSDHRQQRRRQQQPCLARHPFQAQQRLLVQLQQPRRYHSHGHSHAHDHGHSHSHGAIDTSSREGTRITWIGLASNVALTVGKGAGGILWGSASLLADAVHSLLDLISDFVTLYTFRKARVGRDKYFPYGYGKLEPLGSLSISSLLLIGGVGTGYHSFEALRHMLQQQQLNVATGDLTSATIEGISLADPHMSMLALGAIVISIFVKEALFWATMAVAKKTKSDVLVANAWHHRADSISSFVALAGIGGAVAGFPLLDPIGGILVSGMIVQASLTMLVPSLKELSDSAPHNILERVEAVIHNMKEKDAHIVGFSTVRGRKMGPEFLVDLQLQVSPRITVSQSHQIAENVRHAITSEIDGVSEVLIHVDVEHHDHEEDPVATEVPTSKIEEDIVLLAQEGGALEIKRVSHVAVHYLKGGIEVDVEIVPANEEHISYKEAVGIARRFQERLLTLPAIVAADVHLEAHDHHENEGSSVRRRWKHQW